MPPFGQAHNLLSAIHKDTLPPAAGADPDDGQVATWSTALKAWIAADPAPGGVTDHGLLTGLSDDDHSQYVFSHGRAGGQRIRGGNATGEHLTLQSTAHATRGYVRSQDDLQLLSNYLRDSGGNVRVRLATASPHIALAGHAQVDYVLGIGVNPNGSKGIKVRPPAASPAVGILIEPTGTLVGSLASIDIRPSSMTLPTGKSFVGVGGYAFVVIPTGGSAQTIRGLDFAALVAFGSGATVTDVTGMQVQAGQAFFTGTIPVMRQGRFKIPYMYMGSPTIPLSYGVQIENAGGHAGIVDAIGLKIDDILTNTGNKYILELGPATPYFRVIGGGAPAAGLSNVRINVGGTLYNVRTRTLNGYSCLTIN